MNQNINPIAFEEIRRFMRQSAGIQIGAEKSALVVSRLWRRLEALECQNFEEYLTYLKLPEGAAEHQQLLDLLSTNETYFFREPAHFERLKHQILPQINRRPIRIWSAASSSGEEAYSIAMVLADRLGSQDWQVSATDVSNRVLETGRRALYNFERLEQMPEDYLRRFCKRGLGEYQGKLLIERELRSRVTFTLHNLLSPRADGGKFDVIFLRNVLIYFDQATKQRVLEHLIGSLNPDGWLVIGHCDSIYGLDLPLQLVSPSVFRNVRPRTLKLPA
jgi:chemotaxis protein methyltransferase CheR